MSQLEAYLLSAYREVQGWVFPDAIAALQAFAEATNRENISGGACEIGIHHGRFFLALLTCIEPSTHSLAIDLFDEQDRNIDGSGLGSREMFEANLAKHATAPENVTIRATDSLAINQGLIRELDAQFVPFRYFSVDGGHTTIHAFNDLLVAQELTANGGVIILDDFLHPDWPGVTEAVYKYFIQANAKFVPVCIAGKKLFLTSFGYRDTLLNIVSAELKRERPKSYLKTVQINGHRCVSFRLHESDPVLNNPGSSTGP